jgi:hypothetical protein
MSIRARDGEVPLCMPLGMKGAGLSPCGPRLFWIAVARPGVGCTRSVSTPSLSALVRLAAH